MSGTGPDILRSTGLLSVAVPLYISTHVTKFEARALASPSATVAVYFKTSIGFAHPATQTSILLASDNVRIAFSYDSSKRTWGTDWLFQCWILWACEPGSPRAVQLRDR